MYSATNSRDTRGDFSTPSLEDFCKIAAFGVRSFGVAEWSFERDGVRLDPETDLGIPARYLSTEYEPTCYSPESHFLDAQTRLQRNR